MTAPLTARHPGVCHGCPDPIRPGDEIVPHDGGGWVHSRCPIDREPPPPRNPLCPECFLYHAGPCT